MNMIEKLKKEPTFPQKIQYTKIVLMIAGFIGIIYIRKDQIVDIRNVAIALIGVVALFLITAVLRGVLGRLEVASKKLKNELTKRIKKSIEKEISSVRIKTKLKYYRNREFLYQLAGEMDLVKFRAAILFSYIALISSVLISFFEFGTPVDVTHSETGEVIWILSSWHIIYILLIVGLYYIVKLIFYFDEMIRKGEV